MKDLKSSTKHVDIQEDSKIISLEKVIEKGGIVSEKESFFMAYLRFYLTNEEFHKHITSLTMLAEYIAKKELLYVKVRDGYRAMKFSSILTDLCSLNKKCEEILEVELEEKRIYNEKYNCKKKRL